jgi:hypothetical protein
MNNLKSMWNTPTKNELSRIPQRQEVDSLNDMRIYEHFFVGACDWYIAEYDGGDTFFGFANLGDPDMAEWGSVSLRELQELALPVPVFQGGKRQNSLLIEVDRDLFWQVKPFGEINWRK